MEKDLSPWALYKDSMIHIFELVMTQHSQIWGTSSHQNLKIEIDKLIYGLSRTK